MKGVAYFDQAPGLLETVFSKDTYQRDPSNAEKSFQAFQLFLQKFPNSKYSPDARQRLVFLRDRLAKYQWAVADYYMRRGAWIAGAADHGNGIQKAGHESACGRHHAHTGAEFPGNVAGLQGTRSLVTAASIIS
jgi:outer membrane protein assembly factor BamD (BamD/ComL family)